MWNLKYDTNELISETETDSQSCGCQGAGGGMDWEFGVSRCKLLHIEWINYKVLLYSTGNYIQYFVINYNGKEYKNEYIYTYMCIYI